MTTTLTSALSQFFTPVPETLGVCSPNYSRLGAVPTALFWLNFLSYVPVPNMAGPLVSTFSHSPELRVP